MGELLWQVFLSIEIYLIMMIFLYWMATLKGGVNIFWLMDRFEMCFNSFIFMKIGILVTGKHGAVFVPGWMSLWWGWRNSCVWVYCSRAWRPVQTTSAWDLGHLSWTGHPAIHNRTSEHLEYFFVVPYRIFIVNRCFKTCIVYIGFNSSNVLACLQFQLTIIFLNMCL